MRQKLLDHPHRSVQVDLDLARYVVHIASLIEIQVAHDAGVVDERIERGKLRDYATVQGRYRRRIANVAFDGMDAGHRPLSGIELFLVAASDDNRVAPLKKLLRQFKANTARSTGYENGSFFQFHFRLLCVWLIFACLLESNPYTL
jgi:hypothetical protein